MENNNRQGCRWVKEKPDFKKECVFVTATKYNINSEAIDYDYTIWQIKQIDGEDDEGNSCWYWGLLNGDGEEYGALEDLRADFYKIISSPNDSSPCKVENDETVEKMYNEQLRLYELSTQQSKRISKLEEGLSDRIDTLYNKIAELNEREDRLRKGLEKIISKINDSKIISLAKQLLK